MTTFRRTLLLTAVAMSTLGAAYLSVKMAGTRPVSRVLSESKSHLTSSTGSGTVSTAKPDHTYHVAVPEVTPIDFLSATEYTINQGDVVEFAVTTDRPGSVIVHGISDMLPLKVAGPTLGSFRAIYSGRFALHFHGPDGSHFELTALNVMPAPVSKK